MPTKRTEKPEEVTKLVEESVAALHEVDNRLQMIRTDLANLIERTSSLPGTSVSHPLFSSPLVESGLPGGPARTDMPQGQGGPGGRLDLALGAQLMAPRIPIIPRVPTVDLVDQGDTFVVRLELPGVRKDDVDTTVSPREVSIMARSEMEVDDKSKLLLSERGHAIYQRRIGLPAEIQTGDASANLKDGILTLKLKKKQPTEEPRHIDVAYG